ncbi:dihydroneopterin aldolase [Alkalicoccobacillus murimartini]|uniref:7,8-dihydroneopterin aldolase n=1 Tax=Alkalicoccobacillus murimartini TaxID=171685 RepID=A0ABT9YPU6_9BACI|nr:dihydroneopterin aldolase [Alkalicoccobacillus murimartini]MDQ0209232.1 dihydroneopterin aldolase [Alkalicoccobacillus murimartini]
MDKIRLTNMKFYGYHGVFAEENRLGQRFNVDITLEVDLAEAAATDDLTKSIDYGDVFSRVQKIVEGEPKKLLEAVAEQITTELLTAYSILQQCTVVLIKPDPPIPGHYDSVSVEITRSKVKNG